ncbi:hypothetical protein C1645_833406 [Glomus cerebriforme]|uniref:Uncharacterized protein n=1 Tax=Glomus cerebriforme TaxID=658196 RepID=A0A397SFP5_9GLOM|nr:hypothetical protein C1645_833406 [Glomus cerebriforme]
MSTNNFTINIRGNLTACDEIPYIKYFELCPYEHWSLHHYVTLIIENYKYAKKDKAHQVFFNTLRYINTNACIAQEVQGFVETLIKNRKADIEKVNKLWKRAKKEKKSSPRSTVSLPSMPTILGKRQRDPNLDDSTLCLSPIPLKKQCVVPYPNNLCPDKVVPLQDNGTVDIFEVVKSAVRSFHQKTIVLGSTRSYKNSNNLRVDAKYNIRILRESVYDAEMYRILHNWLVGIYGFEVTSQWHLEGVLGDGDYHHFYCDLTIKKSGNFHPEAIIELIATRTISTIRKHFNQVLKYADQLCPREVWIVHFSRENSLLTNPYWPPPEDGLNMIHFWHDKTFENVRMSARFQDSTGQYCEIIDESILPLP